jgi:hypothetical protein
MRFVKLSHKITSCDWDDKEKKWYVWTQTLQGMGLLTGD